MFNTQKVVRQLVQRVNGMVLSHPNKPLQSLTVSLLGALVVGLVVGVYLNSFQKASAGSALTLIVVFQAITTVVLLFLTRTFQRFMIWLVWVYVLLLIIASIIMIGILFMLII